ncbi:MAG: hypothetical protein JNK72_12385 [Myxococcales bacterium]|nr:hypothetical protein [Myxococcales bacterium]
MSERPAEGEEPTRTEAPHGRWSPHRVLFELGFGSVGLVMIAPVLGARHLPLQDLPQHMAAVSVLKRLLFGSSLDAIFEATLSRTQYLLVYLAAIPLSVPFGVEGAAKLLTAVTVLATPYALRYCLRAMGRDPRLAALSLPLLWNPQLLLGFLNFLIGVPIALVTLGLAVNTLGARTRRHELCLAALSLAAFYAHLVPYGLVGLGTLLTLSWPRGSSPKAAFSRLWQQVRFLAPSLAAAVFWVLRTPAGDESVRAGGVGVRPHPEWPALASLARDLSGALLDGPGDFDERALLGWGLAALGAMAVGGLGARANEALIADPRRQRWALAAPLAALGVYLVRHRSFAFLWGAQTPPEATWAEIAWHGAAVLGFSALVASALLARGGRTEAPPGAARLAWLPAACAVLYLTTPSSYGWIWPIHTRFAVSAALLLPLALGKARNARAHALLAALAASVAMAHSLDLSARFSQWNEQELGDLDATLAHAAPGRRLVALTPAMGSGLVPNVPILHAAAYYQVAGGAVATFSFADFPQSPFRYREGATRPPRLPPRWEWQASLEVADPAQSYYDYVLCRRGASDPAAMAPDRYRRVYEGRSWVLYTRVNAPSETP